MSEVSEDETAKNPAELRVDEKRRAALRKLAKLGAAGAVVSMSLLVPARKAAASGGGGGGGPIVE